MTNLDHGRDGLVVDEWKLGAAVVLSAAGAVDMLAAPLLQQHVDRVMQTRPPTLIIDLTLVHFLGSAGIGVLVSTHNIAGDMPYAVVADEDTTSRLLRLFAIDKVIDIYPTLSQAAEALGVSPR